MKQLLRYLVNTILFVVLWCLMFLPVMKYSIDMGATSLASIGGIVAIIFSYKLVKRINKSNLWSSLFNETEIDNKVVEEKKVEATDSNIFNPKNITIGILAIVLISVLYNQNTNLNNEQNATEDKIISKERDLLAEAESAFNNQNTSRRLKSYSTNEMNGDNYVNLLGIQTGKGILTFKSTNQPVTGIVYSKHDNGRLAYSACFKDGVLDGISKLYNPKPGKIFFMYNNMGAEMKLQCFENGKINRIYRYPTGANDLNGTTIITKYKNGILSSKDSVVDGVQYRTKY